MSLAVELPFGALHQERMSFGGLARQSSVTKSLSSSPLCGRRQLRHCPECASAKSMTPKELAQRMEKNRPLLLLDCRPFIAYNLDHIRGALNISCCDRFTKRRLQHGKAGVGDLVSGPEGKQLYRDLFESDVVVYDESTSDIAQLTCATPLHLVLASLYKEGRTVIVLKGGLQEFQTNYGDLCSKYERDTTGPLYSPTTPYIEPQIENAAATEILPDLYLGNERDAANADVLRHLGITHVLNVTSHVPLYFEPHIQYKRLAASDNASQNLKQYFNDAFDFIDESCRNGGKVLVHCQAGVSRSATITVAYIMKRTLMNMVDAYRYVKTKRTIVAPNFNFMGQLLEFEEALKCGVVERQIEPRLPVESKV